MSEAITKDQVVEYIKGMSLLDAAELVKTLEEELGVSAAAPMMMAGGAAAGGEAAEEQTEFDVVLEEGGAERVKVIKAVREITGLGLKEAKDLVDGAPKPILEAAEKAAADEAVAKIEAAGGKATVK